MGFATIGYVFVSDKTNLSLLRIKDCHFELLVLALPVRQNIELTGISYVDSIPIRVCKNKRIPELIAY